MFSAVSRARAIKYRQENQEAVGGFFSQIGELYVVHHLWGRLETLKGPVCPLSLVKHVDVFVFLLLLHPGRGR